MNNLLFGTAGIPLSTKNRNTSKGIIEVSNLNLDAMELEFVRGVNMSAEIADNIDRFTIFLQRIIKIKK